jgi:ABC-type branched-subunit amino acid transport system ATPase component
MSSVSDSLRIEKASKRFGGLRVFDDISFELPLGGIMGVIGPNGAGKTTLINVICGMFPPTSGVVMLGARNITGAPFHTVSRLGVARSFQQTNTFATVSVEENLYRAAMAGTTASVLFSRSSGSPRSSRSAPTSYRTDCRKCSVL